MTCQLVQQLISAERRNYSERRRVCVLAYIRGEMPMCNTRSGFDRRLAIKLLCSNCGKPLFATRDADRRLVLSDRYYKFALEPENRWYSCPGCGASADRLALQQQQDDLLIEKIHFD
jgi:hypothetical protein